ncbi:hypothetical protein DFA_07501 [Cavenderia fasciculata]|uniref:Translation initiation factor 5A C-terminal domain-containing protein n=1 Tax=Cavenderia fasciculata TaxID=261658 RepID=F4PWL3_CACFS|nr:uncharacterized protein DFA_07501 [Cavenderia fasciculata]EGG20377.1 hypothetical protein DFA_07501 [Cavenderia fasciculata]|eukprot:XP_004367360.1 hypothetical protein DFA_07501 [Cavenderia fasciculata]
MNSNNSSPESTASLMVAARSFLEDNNDNDENALLLLSSRVLLYNGIPCNIVSCRLGRFKHGELIEFVCSEYFNKNQSHVFRLGQNKEIEVPIVTIKTYQLLLIDQDGYLSLLDESNGTTREDIKLPKNDKDLTSELQLSYNLDNSLNVQVAQIMGIEGVISFNQTNDD